MVFGVIVCAKVEVAERRTDNQDTYLEALKKNREEDGAKCLFFDFIFK